MADYYLVKRGLYYCPAARGYTDNVCDAGIFTEVYAKTEEESTHGDVKAIPVNPPSKWTHTLRLPERDADRRKLLGLLLDVNPNSLTCEEMEEIAIKRGFLSEA